MSHYGDSVKLTEEHLRRTMLPEQRFQVYLGAVAYLTALDGLSSINTRAHRDAKVSMESIIVQAHERYKRRGYS